MGCFNLYNSKDRTFHFYKYYYDRVYDPTFIVISYLFRVPSIYNLQYIYTDILIQEIENTGYFINLKPSKLDKFIYFVDNNYRYISAVILFMIIVLLSIISFTKNTRNLNLFIKSFFIKSPENLLFFILLLLSVVCIYYIFQEKVFIRKDIRYRLNRDLKKVFDLSYKRDKKIDLESILVSIFQLKNGKISDVLELPKEDFIKKIRDLSLKEFSILAAILSNLLDNNKKIGIYDFLLSSIRLNSGCKELFFEYGIDYKDLMYYLTLLSEGEKIQEARNILFKDAQIRQSNTMNKALTAKKTLLLDSVCKDMTLNAKYNRYPYIISRDKEIEDILRILKKNGAGVLLVGKAGVGKSAITQKLSYLMAAEKVPFILQDRRLMLVNIGLLLSSKSMVELLEEVKTSGNIVLVFDDISNLIGAEKHSEESSMDAFTVLSDYIENFGVKVIGSITPKEYSKYMLSTSSSASRQIEVIDIEPVSEDEIYKILLLNSYRIQKKLSIDISIIAIKTVYELSKRYITNLSFPAKGISLLEEVSYFTKDLKQRLVTSDLVKKLVSKKINIDITTLTKKESKKLMDLEQNIHKRLIGQDQAVKSVSQALRRARLNLNDTTKTISNFLFIGSTGVGKTELAKSLAYTYFGDEKNMVRIDMSEFQEQRSISKLIGDPLESKSGGILTNAILRKPFSLLLLDELEKSHPDILNLFLQVMDDGRLTDGLGNMIDFTNVIIISTSNVGSLTIQSLFKQGVSLEKIKTQMLEKELITKFRPEFLNRFDDIILFHPLSETHIAKILELSLIELRTKLYKQGVYLEWDDKFKAVFVKKYFSISLGARPIKRAVQDNISNFIAEKILSGDLKKNQTVFLKENRIDIL